MDKGEDDFEKLFTEEALPDEERADRDLQRRLRESEADDERRTVATDEAMAKLGVLADTVRRALGNTVDVAADRMKFSVSAGPSSVVLTRDLNKLRLMSDGREVADFVFDYRVHTDPDLLEQFTGRPTEPRKEWAFGGHTSLEDVDGRSLSLEDPEAVVKTLLHAWRRAHDLRKS
ncbi:MAG: hypothetical protein Q8P18_21520 [Pseudomonadota bacterium]|nr:hypothetical protein [Pseudomonadota bacterium]